MFGGSSRRGGGDTDGEIVTSNSGDIAELIHCGHVDLCPTGNPVKNLSDIGRNFSSEGQGTCTYPPIPALIA